MKDTGILYEESAHDSPFDTFLKYTDQKVKSAEKLAEIFSRSLKENSQILDVGSDDGTFLYNILLRTDLPNGINLTLVEPRIHSMDQLNPKLTKKFRRQLKLSSVDFQEFSSEKKFDVILMSHLFYHASREDTVNLIKKALSMLSNDGVIVVVLREEDDVYQLKMKFKPMMFGETYKAKTLNDVLNILSERFSLDIKRHQAVAELKIPIDSNHEDATSIIEFYLHKRWGDIPTSIQKSVLEFIRKKDCTFRQVDGVAVISGNDSKMYRGR